MVSALGASARREACAAIRAIGACACATLQQEQTQKLAGACSHVPLVAQAATVLPLTHAALAVPQKASGRYFSDVRKLRTLDPDIWSPDPPDIRSSALPCTCSAIR